MEKIKPVLAWAKKNLVSVIAIVVALAAFPTMFVLSSGRAAALRAEVEQEVNGDLRDLNSISVNYQAPTLDPASPGASFSRPPNAATTAAMESLIAAVRAEADRLAEIALESNRPNREPLVQGLFPEPNPAESTAKRQEMARTRPGATRDLLRQVGAGGPPAPEIVLDRIASRFDTERRRLLGADAADTETLPEEELVRIREELGLERLGIYQARAEDISFFATPDTLVSVSVWDETRGAPSLERCWEWQWSHWVHEDVLRAIARANTDEAGQPFSAVSGPVKRLLGLSVPEWDLESAAASAQGQPPANASLSGEIRRDFEVSVTGRAGWPATQNPMYDVRYADLSLLVDSSRVAMVLEAFARAGLMSVVSVSVEDYDPAGDLLQGYYYGPDHLVRVSLRVETIWLRQWMAPMVPRSLRTAMGIPDSWANPTPTPTPTPEADTPDTMND